MNADLRSLALQRQQRQDPVTYMLTRRNQAEDRLYLRENVIGIPEDYNPVEFYSSLENPTEFDEFVAMGLMYLFDDTEEVGMEQKTAYVQRLLLEIKAELAQEIASIVSGKQKAQGRLQEAKMMALEKALPELNMESLLIGIRNFNREKGSRLHAFNSTFENTIFMKQENVLIIDDAALPRYSVGLSRELYRELIASGIFKKMARVNDTYPFLAIHTQDGLRIALRIEQDFIPSTNNISVSSDVYRFLRSSEIKGGKIRPIPLIKADVSVVSEPHLHHLKLRSAHNCGAITVDPLVLSEILKRDNIILYLGQEVDYQGCPLIVAELVDQDGREVPFGNAFYNSQVVNVTLDLTMEETPLYDQPNAWANYL